MKLRYFAWVRERVGCGEEEAELPPDVLTVSDLLAWLRTRGEGFAHAFETDGVIRVAVDQVHAKPSVSLAGAREVAFFPPMTGG